MSDVAKRAKADANPPQQEYSGLSDGGQNVSATCIDLDAKNNSPRTETDIEQTVQAADFHQISTKNEHEEIVELEVDPTKLDAVYESVESVGDNVSPYRKTVYKIDQATSTRINLIRSIPNFQLLGFKTTSSLPRFLWRVVHSASAGEVVMDGQGAHFHSQARKLNGSLSDFVNFEMQAVREQLKRHVNIEKKNFNSHWISMTDSFEHALVRAERC